MRRENNNELMSYVRRKQLRFERCSIRWIAYAHRGDGKRFIVRADEKLTAFVELEWAIRAVKRSTPN